MTTRKIITIDGGNAEYWLQRKKGFRLICEAECAAVRLADALRCLARFHHCQLFSTVSRIGCRN
ncbi:MAG: hypothetical protein E5X49_16820 [Mesorhizobium sp.]|nr:MAG: hypothetical protein E5X49_16820 [Mesorhizobium sp.]